MQFKEFEIEAIYSLAEKLTGSHQQGRYRKEILVSNVQRRMQELHCRDLMDYLKQVAASHEELQFLISSLTIHTTSWFRESPHFEALGLHFSDSFHDKVIRVVIAACSSGQETYTLGMVLEGLRRSAKIRDYEITSCDIDPLVVKQAEAAVYPGGELKQIPKFFRSFLLVHEAEETFTICDDIRRRCRFFRCDLRRLPQKFQGQRFDLILCRNVLIYFHLEQIPGIIEGFEQVLDTKGLLCLGHNEPINLKLHPRLKKFGTSIFQKQDPSIEARTTPGRLKSKALGVLMLGDSELLRPLAEGIKRDPSFELDFVKTLPELEASLARQKFALTVVDVSMLQNQVKSWIKRFRQQNARIPLMLCGNERKEKAASIIECLEAGAQDFLEADLIAHDPTSCLERLRSLLHQDLGLPQARENLPRETPRFRPELLLFGASTGGTSALAQVLANMPPNCPPLVIVQHINHFFAPDFARRLSGVSGLPFYEGPYPAPLKPGFLYMAVGDTHIQLSHRQGTVTVDLSRAAPANRHRPSVDVLFHSAVGLPLSSMACLLTGMGSDGASGLEALKADGAFTMAQDEASSVVYGMPKIAIERGAARFVGDLAALRRTLIDSLSRQARKRMA